ncbi:MAG: DUF4928 family protein, partial [Planctomycetaceae bacterium]|nr:DUF4928 family protein [Planctomycetaceae bacterium]
QARDSLLNDGILHLADFAHQWLRRQNLKVNCDLQFTPTIWIESILEQSKGRSGGKVEQHLIGAKLERRFPNDAIENHAGHAGDAQTGRLGDFTLGNTVYHVTASPGLSVIDKCGRNLAAGQRPILLVPRAGISRAIALAEERQLERRIMISAIEDFIGLNIVEMALGRDSEFLTILKEIVDIYNRRLRAVETDLSLQIEVD